MKNKFISLVTILVYCCTVTFAQDIIVTKDAKQIKAKITEVSKSEIRYKDFDNLNGPVFVLPIEDINSIIYSNGKVSLFTESGVSKKEEKVVEVADKNQEIINTKDAVAPQAIDENSITILTIDGQTITGTIISMTNGGVTYEKDGKRYTLFAEQLNKVALSNGQIKTYNHVQTESKVITELPNQQIDNKASDNNNTTREDTPNYTQKNKKMPCHHGYLEVSGIFERVKLPSISGTSMGNTTAGGFGIDGIDGCRFNQYFFFGAGVGFYGEFYSTEVTTVGGSATLSLATLQTPVFADLRIYIPTRIVGFYPYFETSIGPLFNYYTHTKISSGRNEVNSYSTNLNVGAFFRLNTGLEVKRFVFGIGYELWGDSKEQSHIGFIKLGVRFGKNLY